MATGCAVALGLSAAAGASDYTAEKIDVEGIEVVRLYDRRHDVGVHIVPSFGNNAYEMSVRGRNVLWSPHASLADWTREPAQGGNPLLAPWANRIDGDEYFANGRRLVLNPQLGNFRRDGNGKPIHGLLVYAPWQVTSLHADAEAAVLVSRLEFYRRPDWMAQFPFAHVLQVTHRLENGALEVETLVENLASEPLPLSLGYHTYYRVHDAPRDAWTLHLAARTHLLLDELKLPTGETQPSAFADPLRLAGVHLDDGFTDLVRGADGWASFWLQGERERVVVEFGPGYPVAVVFAPQGRDFVCFEPMSAVTNAFNLGHAGAFPLPSVPPGETWKARFRIRTEGF